MLLSVENRHRQQRESGTPGLAPQYNVTTGKVTTGTYNLIQN